MCSKAVEQHLRQRSVLHFRHRSCSRIQIDRESADRLDRRVIPRVIVERQPAYLGYERVYHGVHSVILEKISHIVPAELDPAAAFQHDGVYPHLTRMSLEKYLFHVFVAVLRHVHKAREHHRCSVAQRPSLLRHLADHIHAAEQAAADQLLHVFLVPVRLLPESERAVVLHVEYDEVRADAECVLKIRLFEESLYHRDVYHESVLSAPSREHPAEHRHHSVRRRDTVHFALLLESVPLVHPHVSVEVLYGRIADVVCRLFQRKLRHSRKLRQPFHPEIPGLFISLARLETVHEVDVVSEQVLLLRKLLRFVFPQRVEIAEQYVLAPAVCHEAVEVQSDSGAAVSGQHHRDSRQRAVRVIYIYAVYRFSRSHDRALLSFFVEL